MHAEPDYHSPVRYHGTAILILRALLEGPYLTRSPCPFLQSLRHLRIDSLAWMGAHLIESFLPVT